MRSIHGSDATHCRLQSRLATVCDAVRPRWMQDGAVRAFVTQTTHGTTRAVVECEMLVVPTPISIRTVHTPRPGTCQQVLTCSVSRPLPPTPGLSTSQCWQPLGAAGRTGADKSLTSTQHGAARHSTAHRRDGLLWIAPVHVRRSVPGLLQPAVSCPLPLLASPPWLASKGMWSLAAPQRRSRLFTFFASGSAVA